MSLNLRGVHVYEKIPNRPDFRLKETHTAIRLGHEEEHLYLQDGQVFDASGKWVETRPAWFNEEIARISPAVLREAGFRVEVKEKKA
jgi:hypothetical protein